MRKCTKIGQIFGCMEIIDARTIIAESGKENSQYLIRCVKCGAERWHNTNTVLHGKMKCEVCTPPKYTPVKKGTVSKYPYKLYSTYRGMKRRCYSEKCEKYPYYGGRGIRICEEWLNDYSAFAEWALATGWSADKTIDRIDVNGNYSPDNCRWEMQKVQSNNQTRNIHVTYNGEKMTLAQFCDKTGMNYDRARYLIFRKGMSAEEAVKSA